MPIFYLSLHGNLVKTKAQMLRHLNDAGSIIGWWLFVVFFSLIEEYDYRKDGDTLRREIAELLYCSGLAVPLKDLICEIILYAKYFAQSPRRKDSEEDIEELKAIAWELYTGDEAYLCPELWQMPAYLPKIGKMLAIMWMNESGLLEIRNPKRFFSKLLALVTEMSYDIYTKLNGFVIVEEND